VVPAFNEQLRLERTLREIADYFRRRQRDVEILVVDDGSTDCTSDLVEALREEVAELQLIRLPANRGKGYAVRTGVANARGDRVLFCDADGATPIAEIERLERAVDAGVDVAIGSRGLPQEETHVQARLHRRLIGRSFHLLVTTLAVKGFTDTQCGFKLFRGGAAHDLFARTRLDGFAFDVELLVIARLRGYTVREVPVNWVHQPGSRINLVRDSLRMARDLVGIRRRLLRRSYNETQLRPLFGGSGAGWTRQESLRARRGPLAPVAPDVRVEP